MRPSPPLFGDVVVTAAPLPEPGIHLGDEAVERVGGHEALDRAAEAAAVDADGIATVEDVLGHAEGRHGRLEVAARRDVLQEHARARP